MIPRGGFGGVEKYLVFSEDDETGTGKAGFVQRLAYSESVVVKTSEGEVTLGGRRRRRRRKVMVGR